MSALPEFLLEKANFSQPPCRFGRADLLATANHLVERIEQGALLVDQTLLEVNDVDEEDMTDFELNSLFDLGSHTEFEFRNPRLSV